MPKKKYSISWEDERPTSFEVDGVSYQSLSRVPRAADRKRLKAMMSPSLDASLEDQAGENPKPEGVDVEKLILSVFTWVGVVMSIVAGISSMRVISRILGEQSAAGRIVDLVIRREYVNEADRIVEEYYFPVVEFVAVDGRRRSIQLTEGSDYPSYEKGEEVTVLYDPEHPLNARIKSFGSTALMWVLPSITGTLGLAFFGGVIVVRKLMSED